MSARRSSPPPDPHAVLGVSPDAGQAEVTAAYRRAVRACHPDTERPDPERLAAVIAAYWALREPEDAEPAAGDRPSTGTPIPVRIHRQGPARRPDLRAGPVRYHGRRP
ncbi:DnaJ domain-containing protein [Amycolatopsis taiwanensis]|uniref:J domain-containing protein n=1 Tax=Amycolatopsis taiwanensis TaxID=342230 RepID=A0A9W6R179_9PSEU|nr:DnaJ domain-containing protein [Amycolatopsis taiwanensis]GLY66540.1 hypothetical protein Atai01_31590 [Amycolatopsis taiwanensis]